MNPSQELLANLARRFDLRDFVETGTAEGNTLRAVQDYFDRLFSIEIRGVDTALLDEFPAGKLCLYGGSSG